MLGMINIREGPRNRLHVCVCEGDVGLTHVPHGERIPERPPTPIVDERASGTIARAPFHLREHDLKRRIHNAGTRPFENLRPIFREITGHSYHRVRIQSVAIRVNLLVSHPPSHFSVQSVFVSGATEIAWCVAAQIWRKRAPTAVSHAWLSGSA